MKEEQISQWRHMKKKAIQYVFSLRSPQPWKYSFSKMAKEEIAIASAVACLLLNFLKAQDSVSEKDRESWLEYLLSFLGDQGVAQDPADLDFPSQLQPQWALAAHRTRHLAWAVEALGGTLKKPITLIEPFLEKNKIRAWLDDLWSKPWPGGFWAAGNWIMDMGVLLDLQHRHFNSLAALNGVHDLLNGLNEKQDKSTGFWFGPRDSLRTAMAGAMHIYPLYFAYGRRLSHLDKARDHTLSLQQKDGSFAEQSGIGGSQCLDFDAAFILCNSFFLLEDKPPSIRAAALRLMESLKTVWKNDGAFADCHLKETRYWGTKAACYMADQGSLWDTYARLMTLAMCLKMQGHDLDEEIQINHHLFEIWDGGHGLFPG